ncbi:MAG: hypothetical protein DME98_14400 [Verrucomicrobia bacterium]|nr:MAG: hypothetical protein DME98_14400 [Verrucomicrobiota bacterium]PYJ33424.1 MAG: hypothetical protein DME88_08380 [Verrucomicrobiota bacterium]
MRKLRKKSSGANRFCASEEHRLPACSSRQLAEMPVCSVVAANQNVAGKLPATTGQRPVLPRKAQSWLLVI